MPRERGDWVNHWSQELGVPLQLSPRPGRRVGLRAGARAIELSWPHSAPADLVQGFLHSKRAWLRRQHKHIGEQLLAFDAALNFMPPKHGRLLIAGKVRSLDFSGPRGCCLADGDQLVLGGDQPEVLRKLLANHLLRDFQQRVGEMWRHFEQVHRIRPRRIVLKPMRSLWGSCSFNAAMRLNTALLFAPPICTRAVLAHELAHLDHRDHSPRFWARVDQLEPEYALADADLLRHRHLYMRLNEWLFARTPAPMQPKERAD